MPAPNHQAPLTEAEADAALSPVLARAAALVVAVSGGVDSVVLMHLLRDVAQRRDLPVRLVVATVDHGLRPDAAAEAVFVAATARQLDLEHRTCIWSGPKPATGIPAAARLARYDLLAEVVREIKADAVITAHTCDDQAETVLMRLGRGSGIDGLSGMAPASTLPTRHGGLRLLRPLLEFPKSRLIATATARNIAWREDPSNAHMAYERTRMRQAMAVFEELGISAAAITRSARRLRTAREALTSQTAQLLADPVVLHLDPLGFATFDLAIWRSVPAEVRVRLLAAVIRHVGGVEGFLSLSQLEHIERGLTRPAFTDTYAGTKISLAPSAIRIQREEARRPSVETIHAGEAIVWDNRFRVTRFPASDSAQWTVRQLGPTGLKLLRTQELAPVGVRADILHTVPAFWAGDRLVSCPPLAALGQQGAPVNADGGMWFAGRDALIAGLCRKHAED